MIRPIEIIARAIEEEMCSDYEWTPEQFEVWWTKDDRNRHKSARRRQAAHAIERLREAGYNLTREG